MVQILRIGGTTTPAPKAAPAGTAAPADAPAAADTGTEDTGFSLPAPLTQDQILQQAQDEVNAELNSQINPLQNQIGTLQTQSNRVQGDIGAMFSALQPTVDSGVKAVSDAFNGAEQAQNQIFTAAQTNINQIRQSRAAEAQKLAQQMGGPVAVGEFTAGIDPAQEALTYLGAGSQLHTLGYAQAGVQEAAQFAGQVFPLLRTEQTAQARAYYEDKISTIQSQIDDLNASRTSLTNSRLADLTQQNLQYELQANQEKLDQINSNRQFQLQSNQARLDQLNANRQFRQSRLQAERDQLNADRTFQLQKKQSARDQANATRQYNLSKKQLALDAKKATHDWQATLRTFRDTERQIKDSETQLAFDRAGITGTYQGKPTMAARTLTRQENHDAAVLGLDKREFRLRQHQLKIQATLAEKKLRADKEVEWNALLDAATNPTAGKSVQVSHVMELPSALAAMKDPKNSWVLHRKDGDHYYHVVTTHEIINTQPIHNPQALYQFLRAHDVPSSIALAKVRLKLGLPKWKPGQKKHDGTWADWVTGGQ